MYGIAERLDPDSYYALANATYREMVLAGITAVGEFHYLHHNPDGNAYDDANAMGNAVVAAAMDAGLRIALLDTCYLSSGFGAPPEGVQRRFTDETAEKWAARVGGLSFGGDDGVVVGAAVHSVRAVPRHALSTVGSALPDAPLHVHLSEQVAENQACLVHYGLTPTGLLREEGLLSDRLTAVHATHLTVDDIDDLGSSHCYVDFCPTTERDLADGVGPSRRLAEAGAVLTLGSDSHAVIDPFEEMRAVELNERLDTRERGAWRAAELIRAATVDGHRSLGFGDAGLLAPGQWADLVTIDVGSPRTAGTGAGEETVVFAAAGADVRHVVAGGRVIDLDTADVGRLLDAAITAVVA
jgi:formiminoglutamate deiminase